MFYAKCPSVITCDAMMSVSFVNRSHCGSTAALHLSLFKMICLLLQGCIFSITFVNANQDKIIHCRSLVKYYHSNPFLIPLCCCVYLARNTRRTATPSPTWIWRTNTTTQKRRRKMTRLVLYPPSKKSSSWRAARRENGDSRPSSRWSKSTSNLLVNLLLL